MAAWSSVSTCRFPGAGISRYARATAASKSATTRTARWRGLNSAGFAAIDLAGQPSTTVRFKGIVRATINTSRAAIRPRRDLVFDLDNTLYPHHLNLWQQVDERIRSFVADFLKISKPRSVPDAEGLLQALRHHMRGLMAEHGMKPDTISNMCTDRPLAARAQSGARTRSKNCPAASSFSPMARASTPRLMKRLEIDRHFEDVFDIAAADLDPKPLPQVTAVLHDAIPSRDAICWLGVATSWIVPQRRPGHRPCAQVVGPAAAREVFPA